jgi:hypothetical protein
VVQFIYNPTGLANALKRIISHKSKKVGHFNFANGVAECPFGFLVTNPPLAEWIQRLDPNFIPLTVASAEVSLATSSRSIAFSKLVAVAIAV